MKELRTGQTLWSEWFGYGFTPCNSLSIVYSTIEHVSLDTEVVIRGLASLLQREGIVESLGQGYSKAEKSKVVHGYAGVIDNSREMYVCNFAGETREGDNVDKVYEVTWVEV